MIATTDTITDEALAVLVATREARMNELDPFAVARARRLLLEAPGREWHHARHRPRTAEDETDELLDRHTAAILAACRARIAAVDPLAARPVHVVDFDAIGARSETLGGFTLSDGGWHDLRPILPADAIPGPVVTVNVRAEIYDAVRYCPADYTEPEIVESGARFVRWTALHEYAHVVDCEAAGQAILPDTDTPFPADVRHVVAAINAPRQARPGTHGPQWVRALYHVAKRDAWNRITAFELGEWWDDVARYVSGDPGDIVAALYREWRDADPREPLAELLRRPAPPAFLDLIPDRFPSQEIPTR